MVNDTIIQYIRGLTYLSMQPMSAEHQGKSDASVKSHAEMSAEHLGKSGATVKSHVSLDPRRQNSPVDAT